MPLTYSANVLYVQEGRSPDSTFAAISSTGMVDRSYVVPDASISAIVKSCRKKYKNLLQPVSVARTCQKMGMFPRMAVERMIEDPDWRIFKPPDCPGRVERPVQAAAAGPSVAAAC